MKILAKISGFVLSVVISVTAYSGSASACMEQLLLFERFGKSELIFEGHLLRYEKIEFSDPQNHEKAMVNLLNVYRVDKNWKGVQKGQEIKIYPAISFLKDGNLPAMPDNPSEEIITLSGKRIPTKSDVYYASVCPKTYRSTWQNKLLLFFRYPWAFFQ